MWGGAKSWLTLGHQSFGYYLCEVVARVGVLLGHPCLVFCEMVSLVCEAAIRLVSHKPIGGNNRNLELFSSKISFTIIWHICVQTSEANVCPNCPKAQLVGRGPSREATF